MNIRIVYEDSTLMIYRVKSFKIRNNKLYANDEIMELKECSVFIMVGKVTIDHLRYT